MATATPNEQRITAHALEHGWHVHDRDDLQTTVEFRKRGSGYLRIGFGLNGHIRWASTASHYLRTTAAVMDWLASH